MRQNVTTLECGILTDEQTVELGFFCSTMPYIKVHSSSDLKTALECIASILEDRFRGVPLSRPQLYSQVRTAIDKVMGVGVVCDRDLLDICEAVLRIEKPIHGLAFLLERLGGEYSKHKGENFYANVAALLGQNGFNPAKDRNEEIAENIRRLFVSNVYEDMSRNLVRMYGAIKLIYLDGPVFSKLYDGFHQRDDFEIPIWLMVLWVIGGTPPIVNENGRIDQIGYGGATEGTRPVYDCRRECFA